MCSLFSLCVSLLAARSVLAAEPSPSAQASGSVSLDGATGGKARADAKADTPWIDRWPAESGIGELSVYGGLFRLNKEHELFQPQVDAEDQGFRNLQRLSPSFGGRLGYYPRRMFGLEAEGGAMPS
ncbi:MAG: hypothetical protein B7733_03915, partial [Myxococcales bacterium FL481]